MTFASDRPINWMIFAHFEIHQHWLIALPTWLYPLDLLMDNGQFCFSDILVNFERIPACMFIFQLQSIVIVTCIKYIVLLIWHWLPHSLVMNPYRSTHHTGDHASECRQMFHKFSHNKQSFWPLQSIIGSVIVNCSYLLNSVAMWPLLSFLMCFESRMSQCSSQSKIWFRTRKASSSKFL